MLQPGIAFLEEGLGIERKVSVALLGLMTAVGTLFVWYFSKDLKALDTMDFWVGTVMLFVQATILVIIFGWGLGINRGWEIAHEGAEMRIPNIFKIVIKYITPAYLLSIFGMFLLQNIFGWNYSFTDPTFTPTGYMKDLVGAEPNNVARLTIGFVIIITAFGLVFANLAARRWVAMDKRNPSED